MSTSDQTQGLVAFVRSVEAGSFSGGARLLSTTPSAISKSIARLEARLGVRLFSRSTRLLSLTDEGRTYYLTVSPLVRQLEQATQALAPSGSICGILRVTMPSAIGDYLIDALTGEFMPRHPELRVRISTTDRHADILAEGFDVGVRAGSLPDTALTVRSAGRVPMVLVASPAYLAAHGRPRNVAELSGHSFVRYLLANKVYPVILAAETWPAPEGRLDVDSSTAMVTAAMNGVGIAQLLITAVGPMLADGRLEEVVLTTPRPTMPVQIVHSYGRQPPPRIRAFSDFVTAKIKALGPSDL